MKVLVIGLNHKTANVEIRERLAFNGPKLEEGIISLSKIPEVKEVALLSTCNRVELYTCVNNTASASENIKNFLSEFHTISRRDFEKSLYTHTDSDAVRHIFRVSSSLDSMIVGEPQILGQLKDVFDFALSKKTTGVLLNKLMKKAISTAKRVRTETKIAENAVSISFAAVELARKIFTDLSGKSFMLLGAGEMAELAARHLVNNGVTDVLVVNRTYERGCELAHRPVFIIDISVPRNIDPEINRIENVYLYDVDDLQEVVDTNINERKREAEKAEKIIDEEVEKFTKWMSSLDSVPTIVALRQKAEEIKAEELEKFRNKFPDLDEGKIKAVEYMAAAIMNKLIHPPTAALKEDSEDRDELTAIIKKLYGINGDENEE
ncbi:MAG: glutamyl-tRNA reductase [Nitrospirae bacterium]|nr:glutamyl-tRNA reductase [Nitrospirota bacterium]